MECEKRRPETELEKMKRLGEGRLPGRPDFEKVNRERVRSASPVHRRSKRGPWVNPVPSDTGGFLKTGVFSLLLHVAFIAFFAISLGPSVPKGGSSVYRVTLRPLSSGGTGVGTGRAGSGPGPSGAQPAPSSSESLRTDENAAKSEVAEKASPPQKKAGKKQDRPGRSEPATPAKKGKSYEKLPEPEVTPGISNSFKKGEKSKQERKPERSLQEAMEDVHKRQAMDEIQKRIAQRGKPERGRGDGSARERSISGQAVITPTQGPIQPLTRDLASPGSGLGKVPGTGTSSKPRTGLGSETDVGSGTGLASASGRGTGSGSGTGSGGPPGGVPWGSPDGSSSVSKLDEYCSVIWAKIQEEWTLPEDVLKGKADLVTIIVVVIDREGKVQKTSYDKRSGNSVYDQMAMRAIKKAAPFPPIPKELTDNTLEVGIRFRPDLNKVDNF